MIGAHCVRGLRDGTPTPSRLFRAVKSVLSTHPASFLLVRSTKNRDWSTANRPRGDSTPPGSTTQRQARDNDGDIETGKPRQHCRNITTNAAPPIARHRNEEAPILLAMGNAAHEGGSYATYDRNRGFSMSVGRCSPPSVYWVCPRHTKYPPRRYHKAPS